ncbi:MAG: FeS assembly protein SufD [Candidatus Tokpelaia hoelldobleri]|uniref:FeS assembly protein SufD n=1 Tax=Candidatus Tokpelaia hoelldobleri TaxID=1902579 RepID=A0A1U9JUU1_9HYPH|nr:MAG: FeS assembly protein SufD [Candidatus Tokpelaia hoelldoblerii]
MTTSQHSASGNAAQQIVETFAAVAGKLPEGKSARKAAIKAFEINGLPSRRLENWHYTDLKTLLANTAPYDGGTAGAARAPLLPESLVLSLAEPTKTAKGIMPLAEALAKGETLPQEFAADDAIGQINTAFAKDGWKMTVPAKAKDVMLELQNIRNGGQAHMRFPVTIGAGANVTVIERQGSDSGASFVSSLTDLEVGDNAQVTWVIVRQRGDDCVELNRLQARLGKNSRFTLYIINAGVRLLRQEVKVDLLGSGADFQLRGVNLLAGKTHTDISMEVRHLVEGTTSTEIVRNVVMDEARGVFQGMIRVAQIAQKTDARMACNSLILSDKAEFDAKPELEIFADDVACGHGATVTEIDRTHLFYLMARGIPEKQARALLIKAFVDELVEELENETLETALKQVIDQWLETHE